MRTRPYRNERIISALRELYFTGGSNSFAMRFLYLFPTYELREGADIRQEVPIPMVALVATAVSLQFFLAMYSADSLQVVCVTVRVAHWRTTGGGVLSQRILGCIQGSCRHIKIHSGPPCRRVSPDDDRHLYQSKVRSTLIETILW